VAGIRKWRCGRFMEWVDLVAACSVRDDMEGPTDMVGKLGDAADLSVALDLDADQDKVTRGKTGS
jgi:hypothetical protein